MAVDVAPFDSLGKSVAERPNLLSRLDLALGLVNDYAAEDA